MDKFDNDISQMHNQIDIIKNSIDSMKNKSQKAMTSIIESIHSLSKPKSSKTTRSSQITPKEKKSSKLFKDCINSNVQAMHTNDTGQNLSKNNSNCFRQNNHPKESPKTHYNNCINSERQKPNYHMTQFQTSPIATPTNEPLTSNRSNLLEDNKSEATLCYSRPTIKKDKLKNDYHNRTLTINVNNSAISKPIESTLNNELDYNRNNSNPNSKLSIMTESNVNAQFDYSNIYHKSTMQRPIPQAYINSIKRHKRDKAFNNYNKSSYSNRTNSANHHDLAEGTYKKIVNELIDVLSSHNDELIHPNELVDKVVGFISKAKAKDTLINNILKLYMTDSNIDHNANVKAQVEIIDLWKWIQRVSREDEDNQRNEVYKSYCEVIMRDYNLSSFDEMKVFVNEMLSKNNKNEKFVEGMKKILCNDPVKKKRVTHHNSFNYSNNLYTNAFYNSRPNNENHNQGQYK